MFHPCKMQATLIDNPNICQRGNGTMNAQDDPHQTTSLHVQSKQHNIHAARQVGTSLFVMRGCHLTMSINVLKGGDSSPSKGWMPSTFSFLISCTGSRNIYGWDL